MMQDFYVKLPFYVTEGTVPRYVSVSFDGETVIPKTEIISRDMRNPSMLTFQVSKEAGIYDMRISIPDHSFEEMGAIVLKHFYISSNNIDWYDNMVLGTNTDESSVMTIDLEEANAPHLSALCGFWFGNPIDFKLEVPSDWNDRYHHKTIESVIAELDSFLEDPDLDENKRAIIQANRDKISTLLIAKNS